MAEVPRNAGTGGSPTSPPRTTSQGPDRPRHPVAALRDEVDRIFDNFWRGFGVTGPRGGEDQAGWRMGQGFGAVPAMDVVETSAEYRITAELPGLVRENVELSLSGEILTIRGEKHEQRDESSGHYHLSERRYGSFRRSFHLPQDVDKAQIDAGFEKGVLTVTLGKSADAAQQTRRIDVRPGD